MVIVNTALTNLEDWAGGLLVEVCRFLRLLDASIVLAHGMGESFESLELLGECYHSHREFEGYFEILNGPNLSAKRDLWREWKS